MSRSPTRAAVAETATLEQAELAAGRQPGGAAGGPAGGPAGPGGPGATDPLIADLRRNGLLPLLVLHELARGRSYGNRLIEHVHELTGLAVNPNTMYPLLRSLEQRGLVAGAWEHPERRTRRFYELTPAGAIERERLAAELEPRFEAVAVMVTRLRRELFEPT